MPSLTEILTDDARKGAVVRDTLTLIDQEVGDKGGLSGMAIKTAYKSVKAIAPDFLERVVEGLLPEFAGAADPVYQEAVEQGKPVAGHLRANAGRVADGLLAITDARAERTKYKAIATFYGRLRKTAKGHVEAAIPRLGAMIEKHTG